MKDAKGHGSNARNGGNDGNGSHSNGVNSVGRNFFNEKVLETIRNNPGGFSITPQGEQPSAGYMVSVPNRTQIVSEADLRGPAGREILDNYGRQHADVLNQPGMHVGGWTDKDSGKTYLDVSENIRDRERAVQAGRERNQIAIWDVGKGEEVRTGGTGEQFEHREEHEKVNLAK
jgi:hypothetical protein